jgi:hypothetical protein
MDAAVLRRQNFRVGAVAAVALATGLVAWIVLRDNGGAAGRVPEPPGPTAVPIWA